MTDLSFSEIDKEINKNNSNRYQFLCEKQRNYFTWGNRELIDRKKQLATQ